MQSSIKPLISIVTIALNASETISATLASVAGQYVDESIYEHIVIDGKSQDDTLNIVQGFARSSLHWISEPDDGISDAFNKGWVAANGDYILFLNAGDWLFDTNVLNDVHNYIVKTKYPEWVVGGFATFSADGKIVVQPRRYPPSCWSLIFRNRIGHPAVFLKRSVLEAVGGFNRDVKVAMDYDLWLRICALGIRPKNLPRTVSVFSLGGISSTSNLRSTEMDMIKREFRDTLPKRLLGAVYDYSRRP